MEKIVFSCTVENNSEFDNLGLEFWLDNDKFFDNNVAFGTVQITHVFDETEAEHRLKIVLKGKTIEHTTVDDNGNILSDVLITIKNMSFDDIDIDQLFFDNAVYTHDYNGSGNWVDDEFYGDLGCNGTIEFKFSTPFYIWLLEHM